MQQPILDTNSASLDSRKDFFDSASFSKSFFKDLLVKTFEGVGMQNAKRMAPRTVSLQFAHILSSFTNQGFTESLQLSIKLQQQKDFKPPEIDNLAVQQINSQKQPPIRALPQIVEQATSTKSRFKTKKTVTESIRSRRVTQISEEIPETKSKQLAQFQKLPEVANEFDFTNDSELNKVRASYFNIENEKNQRQKQLNALREKNLVERQKNQKVMKDMKRITYDYEGKLFGQGAGISHPEKLMVLKNKYSATAKNIMLHPKPPIESTAVETTRKRESKNERKDYKQAPLFRDKDQSIIQTIETTKGISAGVKIIEEISDKKSVTKENPLKKPTIHSLADFKNTMKESRFREYHPVSLGKQKSSMNISSIPNEQTIRSRHYEHTTGKNSFNREAKSKSSYSLMDGQKKSFELLEDVQSSRVERSILGEVDERIAQKKVKYRGLPFIRSKGFRAVDVGSEKSFKLVEEKGDNLRQKIRSKILINDINLLKMTLEDLA